VWTQPPGVKANTPPLLPDALASGSGQTSLFVLPCQFGNSFPFSFQPCGSCVEGWASHLCCLCCCCCPYSELCYLARDCLNCLLLIYLVTSMLILLAGFYYSILMLLLTMDCWLTRYVLILVLLILTFWTDTMLVCLNLIDAGLSARPHLICLLCWSLWYCYWFHLLARLSNCFCCWFNSPLACLVGCLTWLVGSILSSSVLAWLLAMWLCLVHFCWCCLFNCFDLCTNTSDWPMS
jgi:hypothetical protein